MKIWKTFQTISLTAATLLFSVSASFADPGPDMFSESERLDDLFMRLQDADPEDWIEIEGDIQFIWGHSGSDSMDMLLERGLQAMMDGEFPKAIEHLSALIDHAPDFAEGWNTRATAYYMMDEYGLSIEDLRQTLARNPRHFGALAGLGMIFEELDNPEGALQAYLAAQAVHPHLSNINEAVIRLSQELTGVAL